MRFGPDLSVGVDELNKPDRQFPIHGNFCGPGVPDIKSVSIDERVSMLSSMESIDLIDKVCKEHDICYVENGYKNPECDLNLLSSLYEYRPKSNKCRRLTSYMRLYFESNTPLSHPLVNANPIKYAALIFVSISMALIHQLPLNDEEKYSNVPERYEKCD